jgi:polyisoprenoid-binding protein YceI
VLIWILVSPVVLGLDLLADRSAIHYLSIKKGAVAEIGQFVTFNGSLSEGGQLQLEIDLFSVDSGIEQRDQRMRDFLFEVARFPMATVKAQLAIEPVRKLKVGEELLMDVNGQLQLHGIAHPVTASILVVRLADGALRASTLVPIVLNVDDFALTQGLEKLRSLAALSSIDSTVPVFFSLVFSE